MKCSLMAVLTALPLGACADAGEPKTEVTVNEALPEEVQTVLRRSVENLVFVEGGAFRWVMLAPTLLIKASMRGH
jgi:hypothetical protein